MSEKNYKVSQNRMFSAIGDSLTKIEIEPVKHFDFLTISSGAYKEAQNHVKTIASNGAIRPIISAGGCRFICGPIGDLRCGCHDPRHCHKGRNSVVLVLTPRCYQYHDRHVPGVTA